MSTLQNEIGQTKSIQSTCAHPLESMLHSHFPPNTLSFPVYVCGSETWESIFHLFLCRPVHCAIPHLQTWTRASFTFSKDLRWEPHAAPYVHLIKSPPQRPASVAALGGSESGGRWRQLIESLRLTDACPWRVPFLRLLEEAEPTIDRGGWWGDRCGGKPSCC